MAKKTRPSTKKDLTPKKLGAKIQNVKRIVVDRMNAKGLTPYALAKLAREAGGQLTEQTVRNFVRGDSEIRSDKLTALMLVLDLELRVRQEQSGPKE